MLAVAKRMAPPRRSRLRILVGGEPRERSAPTISLAAELERIGVPVEYWTGKAEVIDRVRQLRRNHALVFVHYLQAERYLERNLQLARVLGCMVVRWWVGTDVFNCLREPELAYWARRLDATTDLNLAVAPHLVDELATLGIKARYSPSVFQLSEVEVDTTAPLPKSVLVYLPTERRAFYGEPAVQTAVENNPDLTFVVVGDESHSLARFPNVRSLGWVADMDALWSEVGAVLRTTEHDGLPRFVLEALLRGRYVIYSTPLEGCWFASSPQQIQRQLDRFKHTVEPNREGPPVAQRIGLEAPYRFIDAVLAARTQFGPASRLGALVDLIGARGRH